MEMIWDNFWMIQGIGFAAFAADTALCHVKNGRKMMALSVPPMLAWGLHYALLGGITGALMCLATALRTTLTLCCPPTFHRYIFAMGIAIITAVTALSWQGFISLLPFFGSVSYCFSVLKPDCRLCVRLSWAASIFFWLIYGAILGSWSEVVASTLGILSIGWAIIGQDAPVMREKIGSFRKSAARYSAASAAGLFFFVASISAAFFSTISAM